MKKVVIAVLALFAVFTFIQAYSAAQEDHAKPAALAASAQTSLPN